MLLWIFRTLFVIVILAALFLNLSSPSVSADKTTFRIILWCGAALAGLALMVDLLS